MSDFKPMSRDEIQFYESPLPWVPMLKLSAVHYLDRAEAAEAALVEAEKRADRWRDAAQMCHNALHLVLSSKPCTFVPHAYSSFEHAVRNDTPAPEPSKPETCEACGGKGHLNRIVSRQIIIDRCPKCKGTGEKPKKE